MASLPKMPDGPPIAALGTRDPWVVPEDEAVAKVADLMLRHHIRHVPVVDPAGHLVGVVLDFTVQSPSVWRHASRALDPASGMLRARDLMLPVEVVARAESPLVPTLRRMLDRGQDVVVIVDVGRHPIGIVTEHDIVRVAVGILPDHIGTAEVGSAPVYTIEWSRPAVDALAAMVEHRIRHVVVTDRERIYGVVSYRDLAVNDFARPDLRVVDAMRSGKLVRFTGDRSLRDAVTEMVANKIGCIPIVDSQERPIRVVTRTDVVEVVMGLLAEDDVLLDLS